MLCCIWSRMLLNMNSLTLLPCLTFLCGFNPGWRRASVWCRILHCWKCFGIVFEQMVHHRCMDKILWSCHILPYHHRSFYDYFWNVSSLICPLPCIPHIILFFCVLSPLLNPILVLGPLPGRDLGLLVPRGHLSFFERGGSCWAIPDAAMPFFRLLVEGVMIWLYNYKMEILSIIVFIL